MAGESLSIEYKESWNDDYLKWICGFANAQGGILYIGKDDKGRVVGVKNAKKLMEDIPNKVRDILGIIVDVNLLSEEDKEYLEIVVLPYVYPVNYKGEYHYRSGSTKQQLKGPALNNFLLKRMGITWDSVPIPNLKVSDFRNDSFDIFREMAIESQRLSEMDLRLSNEKLLESLNLMDNGLVKRAGIMLFHHQQEKWVPGAYIKIGKFRTNTKIEYQDEIHGSLLQQVEQILDHICTKYLKAIISFQGVVRVENWPVPITALREAIFNAIIHKDYGTLNPIQISIHPDSIYIANDGYFPEQWTPEQIFQKHQSRPFNPLIASALFRAGRIEAWGRGIETIGDECVQYGLPLPNYTIHSTDIMVSFKTLFVDETKPEHLAGANSGANSDTNSDINSDKIFATLSNTQKQIILAIQENKAVTQRKIAEKTGLALSTVISNIEQLKKMNILSRTGTHRKGTWNILLDNKGE